MKEVNRIETDITGEEKTESSGTRLQKKNEHEKR
jgi:hypothetical protein